MREPGSSIGPYRVVSLIGRGGMGEVYRAHDARLLRDVAVKVLHDGMSGDPEFVRRFEREAQSASALSHPNIVTIYDVGQEGQTPYIAMELVSGVTLRQILAEGRLPTRRLIDIARQIADGLATAHERGIVHRDLKPENVIVTRDSAVKVLDFGLAKAIAVAAAPTVAASTDARAPLHTAAGTVLGTLAYMSPEQAAGGEADHRSDLFSFGALLYEMVAGRPAFRRDTAAGTLAAVLREEPPPLPALEASIDAPMRWVIERCLAKEPEARYASTRDLLQDLTNLRHELSRPLTLTPGRAWRDKRGLLRAFAFGVAALAVGLCWPRARVPAVLPNFKPLTFARGTIWTARFASDGNSIVYAAAWDGRPFQLFRKSPESPESVAVSAPPADLLAISSKGEIAALVDVRVVLPGRTAGVLARLPAAGGAPRRWIEDVEYADWAPNGEDLAVVRTHGGRSTLEFPVGHEKHSTNGWISHPRVSRDGHSVAFLEHPMAGDDRGSLKLLRADGTVATMADDWGAAQGLAWSADGKEIWVSGAASDGTGPQPVYAVAANGARRVVLRTAGDLRLLDVSSRGQILVARQDRWLGISFRPASGSEQDLSLLGSSVPADLSADGSTLLFTEFGEAGGPTYGCYLRKTDGSPAVRLGDRFAKALSPDLAWALAFQPAPQPALVLLPSGPGEPRTLDVRLERYHQAGFFPRSGRIVVTGNEPGHDTRIYVQDLAGGPPRPISPEGIVPGVQSFPVSPDEQWVCGVAADGRLYLYPVAGGTARAVPGDTENLVPIRWSSDGRRLFAARLDRVPTDVLSIDLSSGATTRWAAIAPPDRAGVHGCPVILMAADEHALAYAYARVLSQMYLVSPD